MDDGSAVAGSENSAPAQTQTQTQTPEASNGSFDMSTWDGNRSSLPNEHHAIFDKIETGRQASRDADAGKKLQAHLQKQFEATVRAQGALNQTKKNDEGEEVPLTREQALQLFQQQETQRTNQSRINDFRKSMLDVVGTPQQFGDATVVFSSESEVDDFRDFVTRTLNGELTAKNLLGLYRAEDIRRQHADTAIKNFEKKLNRKPSDNSGGSVQTRTSTIPTETNGKRRKGRVPSTADVLKENNPELFNNFMAGKANLF